MTWRPGENYLLSDFGRGEHACRSSSVGHTAGRGAEGSRHGIGQAVRPGPFLRAQSASGCSPIPVSEALGHAVPARAVAAAARTSGQDATRIVRFYPGLPRAAQPTRCGRETETSSSIIYVVRENREPDGALLRPTTPSLNERLAKHYGYRRDREGRGLPPGFDYPDDRRKGIFGHGSILTLTSVAGRTSPVLRGKWVMIDGAGHAPAPAPARRAGPGRDRGERGHGRQSSPRASVWRSTARTRSARDATEFMDPIGLSLDNFDVTGRWRIRENGIPLDTRLGQ